MTRTRYSPKFRRDASRRRIVPAAAPRSVHESGVSADPWTAWSDRSVNGAVVAGPEVRAVLCIYTDRTVGGSRHGEHPRHSSIILEIFSPLNVNNVLITSSHPRNGSALRIGIRTAQYTVRHASTPSGPSALRSIRPRLPLPFASRVLGADYYLKEPVRIANPTCPHVVCALVLVCSPP